MVRWALNRLLSSGSGEGGGRAEGRHAKPLFTHVRLTGKRTGRVRGERRGEGDERRGMGRLEEKDDYTARERGKRERQREIKKRQIQKVKGR